LEPRNVDRSNDEALRAYLGVTFEPEFPNVAVARSIAPGSPAEQAGLRAGDVIETLNGQRVDSYQDVLDAVRWMRPGDLIDITVSRRLRIQTHAVLEPAPNGYRRTVDLPTAPQEVDRDAVQPAAAEELLPPPAFIPARSPQPRSQLNSESISPRRYTASQELRRPDAERVDRRTDRERNSRNRGLFLRRRMGRQ
jgi:membrane-associated protease RseP (regulator of RpoE activity)